VAQVEQVVQAQQALAAARVILPLDKQVKEVKLVALVVQVAVAVAAALLLQAQAAVEQSFFIINS
jgi:hypothetical protein